MGLRKSILAFKPFCGNFSSVFSASKLRFTEPGWVPPLSRSCAPSLRASSCSPNIMVNPVAQQAPKSPRTMAPSTAVHFAFHWRMTSLTLILTQRVGTKVAHEVRSSPSVLRGWFFKIDVELQVQNRLKTADWVSWCFMCLPNIWHRQPSPMRKSWPTNRGSMSVTVGWESLTKGSFAKGSYNSSHGANLDFLACLNFN